MRIFYSAVIGIVLGSLFPPLLISQTWTADKRSNDVESTRFLIGGRIVVSLPEQTVESEALHAGRPCAVCSGQQEGLPHLRRRDEGPDEIGGQCFSQKIVAVLERLLAEPAWRGHLRRESD